MVACRLPRAARTGTRRLRRFICKPPATAPILRPTTGHDLVKTPQVQLSAGLAGAERVGTRGTPGARSLDGPSRDGPVVIQASSRDHRSAPYPASPPIPHTAENKALPLRESGDAGLYTRAERALTAAPGGSVRGAGARGLNRDFQLLLGGSFVSMLGSRITAVAYPLLLLVVTGSPLTAGLSTFAILAPSALVYLPAGVLVDRWDPRRVMFASELGRFSAVAVVVTIVALGHPNTIDLAFLIVAAATEQTLEVFSSLAERRFSLSLVDRRHATSALVRGETRDHLVVMLGRPIGAFLFGLGQAAPFVADALTFVASMTALFHIRNGRPDERRTVRHMVGEFRSVAGRVACRVFKAAQLDTGNESPARQQSASPMLPEMGAVFTWLRSHPFALVGLCLTTGTTLVSQALIMVFFAEVHSQNSSPIKIGIVLAASGAGGVVGSAVASELFQWANYRLLQGQILVWSLTFGCLAFFGGRSYWIIAAAMAALGFAGALGNIAIDTFLALYAGPMLARVLSVDRLTSFCALALGPALGGALFADFGTQSAVSWLFVGTLVLVGGTLAITIVRYLRHRRERRPAKSTESGTGSWPAVNQALGMAWDELGYLLSRIVRAVTWGPAYLLSQQELQEAARMRRERQAERLRQEAERVRWELQDAERPLPGNRSAQEPAGSVSGARN
jgi:MFS family permease